MSHPRLLGQNNSCLFLTIVKVLFFTLFLAYLFPDLMDNRIPHHIPLSLTSTLHPRLHSLDKVLYNLHFMVLQNIFHNDTFIYTLRN